ALEQAYTGDIGAVFWDTFLSQKEVKSQKKPHHNSKVLDSDIGFTVFETHVSYPFTGWDNVLFYMSSNGYIGTNLLPDECVFSLGEDAGEKFLEYIYANCKKIEEK
ncbi:MAG: hypothetical protein K2O03_12470, partial [Lachnospiraceae bacterium]|nr:hypothetical protein [Lachnospiraceae bacterium]